MATEHVSLVLGDMWGKWRGDRAGQRARGQLRYPQSPLEQPVGTHASCMQAAFPACRLPAGRMQPACFLSVNPA